MSNRPTSVKILDVTYRIQYLPLAEPASNDAPVSFGEITNAKALITVYVHDEMQESEIINTIFHELLHALSYRMSIVTAGGNLIDDETAISQLATGINTVMLDNHWLNSLVFGGSL